MNYIKIYILIQFNFSRSFYIYIFVGSKFKASYKSIFALYNYPYNTYAFDLRTKNLTKNSFNFPLTSFVIFSKESILYKYVKIYYLFDYIIISLIPLVHDPIISSYYSK